MENKKEYFVKRIKKNEIKILELQAQNVKFKGYVENDSFPKKSGKKSNKSEIKAEKIENKSILDMF